MKLTLEKTEDIIKSPYDNKKIPITPATTGITSSVCEDLDIMTGYLKDIDNEMTSIKNIISKLEDSDNLTSDSYWNNINHLQKLYSSYKALFVLLNKAYFRASHSLSKIGEKLQEKNILIDEDFVRATYIQYERDVLHIRYPVLLIKKKKYGKENRQKATFTAAIHEYFKERPRIYDDKVVVCFIHHYSSEQLIRDHDNYDISDIVNTICAYALKDDNPKWCSHYQDYIVDGEDYTEVYVIPHKKFVDYYNHILPR